MGENLERDQNFRTVGAGVDPNDKTDIQMLRVDPITKYLLVSVTAGSIGGYITGTNPQTVSQGSNGTAVTAVANTGYTFVEWSDGVLTATRTDLNVQGNINVTAIFKKT